MALAIVSAVLCLVRLPDFRLGSCSVKKKCETHRRRELVSTAAQLEAGAAETLVTVSSRTSTAQRGRSYTIDTASSRAVSLMSECRFSDVNATSKHQLEAWRLPADEQRRFRAAASQANVQTRRAAQPFDTVFSNLVYNCLECISDVVDNTFRYNRGSALVLHFNADMRVDSNESSAWPEASLRRLSSRHGTALLINDDRVHVERKGSGILLAHLSNYCRAEEVWPSWHSFCTLSADLYFVKPGYAQFMARFDGIVASFVDLRSPAGHPELAILDQTLRAAMTRAGLVSHRRKVRDLLIDGLCWRRSLFERLKPEAPFSPSSSYNIDGNWPATLLSPLMNSTPCDDLRRWANYSAGGTRVASRECYPRLVHVEHQISSIDIVEAVRVIEDCRGLGASRCFAVKGFHGPQDAARAYLVST